VCRLRGDALNPIAPYRWAAQYATGRLLQCDVDGWHTSREIDRAQLRALVVLGHPDSPITLPVPRPAQIPDEILVRATTELQATQALGGAAEPLTAQRWTFLGVRYGSEAWVLQIDPAGHLVTRTLPLAAGAPLDPVPCGRCGAGRP
jgi:hypothetical protein